MFTAPTETTLGIDEVGRGCLAGPVVAAAVVLHRSAEIEGLADSKLLAPERRAALVPHITATALSYAIAWVWPRTIEERNILQATLLAMQRAHSATVARLAEPPPTVVDGKHCPQVHGGCRALPGADGSEPAVMAASILAKQARDAWMHRIAPRYPGYAFERNVGYPTPAHIRGLSKLGPCPIHRRSFAPVARILAAGVTASTR